MSKHTPGPLHASCEVGNTVYIRAADGRNLATVNSLEDGIDNAARLQESAANADLFAAAPELATALSWLVASCLACQVNDPTPEQGENVFNALNNARAALRKAGVE